LDYLNGPAHLHSAAQCRFKPAERPASQCQRVAHTPTARRDAPTVRAGTPSPPDPRHRAAHCSDPAATVPTVPPYPLAVVDEAPSPSRFVAAALFDPSAADEP
jgi:hypothetical protein